MQTDREQPEASLRVALVCMPFCAADRPSIQLGLLAAVTQRAGFQTDTFHLNLELAARLTPADYHWLCSHRGHMTGEWLFTVAAFGAGTELSDEGYFAEFPEEVDRASRRGKDRGYLSWLRHALLPEYIDECLTKVDWAGYDVVGFTSTFQQNVASLALARRIKEAFPQIRIVFGGANMEDTMGPEYARAFSFIDHVVVGEGEQVFVALLRALARDEPPGSIPGLVTRIGGELHTTGQAQPIRTLDELPTPVYDEYFATAVRVGLARDPQYTWLLPLETSRGCWWGQKHHCTFCGLNGLGMGYRAKSPARIEAELAELARRYELTFFGATDNILDMRHIQSLFANLAQARTDYQFFYEVKANLTREQIRTLHRGGLRWVQPGIESLSTHVLRLMRKGSTRLQNVRLLKWCRYYRIRVSWNLIWGFPGETAEDYEQELDTLRIINHLEPPHACTRIWLERFSPYFFDREQFPVHEVRAEASYRHVYPPGMDLDAIAYFFDYRMDHTLPDEAHASTQAWVDQWQQRYNSSRPATLTYRRTHDAIFIDDTRDLDRVGTHVYYGPLAHAYEYCSDTMHTPARVRAHLTTMGHPHTEADVRDALDTFCTHQLMIKEDDHYLSLALPTNPNW